MRIRIPVLLLGCPLLLLAVREAGAGVTSEVLMRDGYRMEELARGLVLRDWRAEAQPQLAACAAVPAAPVPKVGQLRVIGLTKDRYFNKFFQGGGKLYRLVAQQKGVPMAIVLDSGQWRLAQLQAALADHPGALERQGNAWLLRLPLLVQGGAGLIVQNGETLRLSRDRGSFIINLGTVHLSGARLEAWDEAGKAPTTVAPDDTASFQPFLLGWSGSLTVIRKTQVSGLGFAENLTHGLAFAAGPVGLAGVELPPPPRVYINGSELTGLYSGIHATAVPELRICDNSFRQSRLNAVHLDIGSGGIVAGNRITESQGPYALYFNRNASNIWIVRNDISENKRSGLSINDSADIVIAGNKIRQNFDAVFVQASERLLFADNEIFDNQRHAVSLRDAGPIRFQNDHLGPNRGVGILAKKAKVPDPLAGTAAKFIPPVTLAKDADASGSNVAGAGVTTPVPVEMKPADGNAPAPAGQSLAQESGPAPSAAAVRLARRLAATAEVAKPPAVIKSALPVAVMKLDPANNRVELLGALLEGNHSSAMEVEAPYNIVFDQAEVMYPDVRRRPVFRGVLNGFETDILFRLPRHRPMEFSPLVRAAAKGGEKAGGKKPAK